MQWIWEDERTSISSSIKGLSSATLISDWIDRFNRRRPKSNWNISDRNQQWSRRSIQAASASRLLLNGPTFLWPCSITVSINIIEPGCHRVPYTCIIAIPPNNNYLLKSTYGLSSRLSNSLSFISFVSIFHCWSDLIWFNFYVGQYQNNAMNIKLKQKIVNYSFLITR